MTKYKNEKTYLGEDHFKKTKEYFKVFSKKISAKKNHVINFLDVGCATGSLLNFLNKEYPNWKFSGIEPSRAMINIAKKNNKHAKFYQADVKEFRTKEKFDLISLFGVLGIFNFSEGKKIIEKLIKMLNSNGELFILSQFNNYDVDVLISHRKYTKDKLGEFENGWNIYSKRTINEFLKKKNVSHKFYDFTFPGNIKKKEDPIRSWTLEINRKKNLTNGLGLIINLKFLHIIRKK